MTHFKTTYTLLSITLALALSTTTYGANACKGEGETACTDNQSCSWIKAHNRKDGAKIKAYCRTKPGKKTMTDASAQPSATTDNSSESDASENNTIIEGTSANEK